MDAVIVMAGKGERLNAGINKVFLSLNDKPLFVNSLNILKKYCDNIILVVKEEELDLVKPYLTNQIHYVFGGKERAESVYNGISATNSEYVLIHDGARPFIDENLLAKTVKSNSFQMFCGEVKDTIYTKTMQLIDRKNLIAAKTPQVINKNIYYQAYDMSLKDGVKFTDEISLVTKYFSDIKVELRYDEMNFKVTTKLDYIMAKEVVKCIE